MADSNEDCADDGTFSGTVVKGTAEIVSFDGVDYCHTYSIIGADIAIRVFSRVDDEDAPMYAETDYGLVEFAPIGP